jgi:hypothetical protein
MGWMTKEFWYDSMAGTRDFSLLQNVQTSSGALFNLYPKLSYGVKAATV